MSKSMSKSDAARIQAAEAKANGGVVAKGGFASRAQAAAAHNSSLKMRRVQQVTNLVAIAETILRNQSD